MSIGVTDLAYTAGIMDGEGSIGIARHKSKSCRRGYTLELYVQVTSSDEQLCEWLRSSFAGSMSHSINSVGNPMRHWIIVANQAKMFLKLISPYLRLKKSQAEIAIKFQDAKKRRPFKSDEEVAIEDAQRITLQNMHRGKNGSHKGITQPQPTETKV